MICFDDCSIKKMRTNHEVSVRSIFDYLKGLKARFCLVFYHLGTVFVSISNKNYANYLRIIVSICLHLTLPLTFSSVTPTMHILLHIPEPPLWSSSPSFPAVPNSSFICPHIYLSSLLLTLSASCSTCVQIVPNVALWQDFNVFAVSSRGHWSYICRKSIKFIKHLRIQ